MQYIADQLREMGLISYRKMFDEYGLYCDGKYVAIICEDQLFLKVTKAGIEFYPELEENPHHEGAPVSYHFVEDVDDKEWLEKLVRITWEGSPYPKPKTKKRKGEL